MTKRSVRISCHSCGDIAECPLGIPPCEGFKGWLTVSYWEGLGSAENYHFCSFSCLESWVEGHVPKVPKAFLESFREDKN